MIFSSAPNDFLNIKYSDELYHHGIKGQKWGIRRYQNSDGTLTSEGKKHYRVGIQNGNNFYGLSWDHRQKHKLNDFKKHSDIDENGKKYDIYSKDVNGIKINFISYNNKDTRKSLENLDKLSFNFDKINNNCKTYLKDHLKESGVVDDKFSITSDKPVKIELDNSSNGRIGLGYKIKTPNDSFTYIMGYDLNNNKPSYAR